MRRRGGSEPPAPAPSPPPGSRMRMAELAAKSGVARETIHFYLREGLLPAPEKGGRTVAFYGEEHLDRLRLIRRLREEKYLPIAVIRRLLDSPAAAGERDVDVLAEVLHIIPPDEEVGRPPSPEARSEAVTRRLLGPRAAQPGGEATGDPAERRVLQAIDEALALEGDARRLTLDDLAACAESLTALVAREASLVFDTMFDTGEVFFAIGALRAGRPAVARYITAYRDLLLRRIVEDVLTGLERGPEAVTRAATIPLSAGREAALGVPELRASLWEAWHRDRDENSAARLVWHLFATGAAVDLAALPAEVIERAGARLSPLVAWGALESARGASTLAALESAAHGAPGFALAQILLGEAMVARGLRRRQSGASLLEQAIPALHRVLSANPEDDPEPAARVFGWFHRGRVELALPAVLGRKDRGVAALQRALAALGEAGEALGAAARARIEANARLALGRHWMAAGETARGKALLAEAAAMDPEGPIARMAREDVNQEP